MGIINEHVKKYTGNAQLFYLVIILSMACTFVGQLVIRTGLIKPVLEICRVFVEHKSLLGWVCSTFPLYQKTFQLPSLACIVFDQSDYSVMGSIMIWLHAVLAHGGRMLYREISYIQETTSLIEPRVSESSLSKDMPK
jgi:hypothetical protein